ncbi:MAG TPA: hypothetical protein VNG90_03540 [Candidatus Acidoferrum sp.]|nr:hypothetical protein [Candidatus Acidoferrum sp.]
MPTVPTLVTITCRAADNKLRIDRFLREVPRFLVDQIGANKVAVTLTVGAIHEYVETKQPDGETDHILMSASFPTTITVAAELDLNPDKPGVLADVESQILRVLNDLLCQEAKHLLRQPPDFGRHSHLRRSYFTRVEVANSKKS